MFVPTGTVDLTTMIFSRESEDSSMALPMSSAAASTNWRLARPSSPEGVPTAIKMISASAYALVLLVVKWRREALELRWMSSSSPGS